MNKIIKIVDYVAIFRALCAMAKKPLKFLMMSTHCALHALNAKAMEL